MIGKVVSRELLLAAGACPTGTDGAGVMTFDVSSPEGERLAREIGAVLGGRVVTRRCDADMVTASVERFANAHLSGRTAPAESAGPSPVSESDARVIASQPPVVRFVNLIVRDGVANRASDIHLDATEQGLSVRMRIDGVLTPGPAAADGIHDAVLSRIKLLADLDIAERRRPQDGRIRMTLGETSVDLRVSTISSLHGESAVIRILDHSSDQILLSDLGMPDVIFQQFAERVARPHGLLLVTGPTGSGKTTTLYAALAQRATGLEKVISVEDPIEIQVQGVTQVPLHREVGVSFATALRALLRHDPDVLMIGELRDPETAAVAVQAAMTGHLVLATLHTNDASGAVARLMDLEVPEYLLADTLAGVLAQRLVRRLCDACAQPTQEVQPLLDSVRDRLPSEDPALDTAAPRVPVGCNQCRNSGFRGRIGIFEFLALSRDDRAHASGKVLQRMRDSRTHARSVESLESDGVRKVLAGLTTLGEVHRAVAA